MEHSGPNRFVESMLSVETTILPFVRSSQNGWNLTILLLARSFALLENRMFSHLHTTAQQRFERLLTEEPELFNRVPLQHIAAMLGITPESLSRLRKNSVRSIP